MKSMKRILIAMLCLVMTFMMTACSVSIGTNSSDSQSSDNSDFDALFPNAGDRVVKTSMGYKFTLGEDYGEMEVHVNTSDGHKFELVENDPAGFNILNKDGDVVLYAACMNDAAFAEYSGTCTEIKNFNGRDFLYRKNGDGSEDLFSHMGDVGLNCGMVFEIKDGDQENFALVAFRGEPLPGSTSEVTLPAASEEAPVSSVVSEAEETVSAPEETINESIADELSSTPTITGNLSLVSQDAEKALESLDTDYKKVNWGVTYTVSDDIPGVVISVAPIHVYGAGGLIIGVTNLYDAAISFAGEANCAASDDSIIGNTYIYEMCIGSGNTAIFYIPCDGEPDGRIQWRGVEVDPALYEYVPWAADYSADLNAADSVLIAKYNFYAVNETPLLSSMLDVLVLDDQGNPVAFGEGYYNDLAAGEKAEGTIDVYNDIDSLSKAADIALFSNPLNGE